MRRKESTTGVLREPGSLGVSEEIKIPKIDNPSDNRLDDGPCPAELELSIVLCGGFKERGGKEGEQAAHEKKPLRRCCILAHFTPCEHQFTIPSPLLSDEARSSVCDAKSTTTGIVEESVILILLA